MSNRVINSLAEMIEFARLDSHGVHYRGVSRAGYPLIPSLGRICGNDGFPAKGEESRRLEKSLFDSFVSLAHQYLTRLPTEEREWLALAQHHGLPTRLLDWTLNPLVALYFSVEKDPECDGRVYLIPQHGGWIERTKTTTSIFDIEKLEPYSPDLTHPRFAAQSCVMLASAEPWRAIEHPQMEFADIPKHRKGRILNELHCVGINSATLFPDLQGLCCQLVRQHTVATRCDDRIVRLIVRSAPGCWDDRCDYLSSNIIATATRQLDEKRKAVAGSDEIAPPAEPS